ncbi:MAG: hypothetical protein ACK46X_08590 [Candidatus Sericytochromatia bacterium]
MRSRPLPILLALALAASAAPAVAAPEPDVAPYVLPNPWQVALAESQAVLTAPARPNPRAGRNAAAISAAAPPILAFGALLASGGGSLSLVTAGVLGMTGFGAGHLMAGHPRRAKQVALGGPAVAIGAGLAGYSLANVLMPVSGGWGAMVVGFASAGIAGLAYGQWAIQDAHYTSQRFQGDVGE